MTVMFLEENLPIREHLASHNDTRELPVRENGAITAIGRRNPGSPVSLSGKIHALCGRKRRKHR